MNKKNELVAKSIRLIEASYRLNLAEQRLVLLAIVRAREIGKGLNAVDFVPITAKDYAERFGLDEKNAYRQLKEAEDSLFYREFTLYDTDPETGNRRAIKGRWISAASYIDGSGTIQLQFSGVILPYITNLQEKFTRYKLEKIAKMSSPYAIRLYELLMQWIRRGWREDELGWLREALMVPEEEYPRLFNFKKRVIDVAVSQINEFSDLTVRYEQRKTGRNVTHFKFIFEPKEPAELGPSPFEAGAKARAKQEAEAKKRAEAQQRAQAKAEREALDRAKAAVAALTALERLMLAEEYREGAGAGRSASWDAGKGVFRDQMERIQFNLWLQARFKAGQ